MLPKLNYLATDLEKNNLGLNTDQRCKTIYENNISFVNIIKIRETLQDKDDGVDELSVHIAPWSN